MKRTSIAAAALVLALAPANAGAAERRYASPTSSETSGACPQSDPCTLKYAIEGAAAGDEVIVQTGAVEYDVTQPITSTQPLNIHGVDGQPRPRIIGVPSLSGEFLELGGTGMTSIRHLHVENRGTGPYALHVSGATVTSNVVLVHPGGGAAFVNDVGGDALLRDSIARASGTQGVAVFAYSTLQLRNVTAVATGTNAHGVVSAATCTGMFCSGTEYPSQATLKNVIARGGRRDLWATSSAADVQATMDVSYSNYRPDWAETHGDATLNDQGNNQSAEPLFADPAAGDYHQLAGSPTIDSGTGDTHSGTTDLDGDPRSLGAAPDIGADEFVPPAPAEGGEAGGTGDTMQVEVPPAATSLVARPARFRAAASGPTIPAARVGTTVSYRLSETARMRFTVQRGSPGRRVRRRCVRPMRSNRTRRKCTRWVTRGSFEHAGAAGANSFRFSGRLGNRKLRPGRYRFVGIPVDGAGNTGAPVRTRFRIVR